MSSRSLVSNVRCSRVESSQIRNDRSDWEEFSSNLAAVNGEEACWYRSPDVFSDSSFVAPVQRKYETEIFINYKAELLKETIITKKIVLKVLATLIRERAVVSMFKADV